MSHCVSPSTTIWQPICNQWVHFCSHLHNPLVKLWCPSTSSRIAFWYWSCANGLANVVKCGLLVRATFVFQKKSQKNPIFKEMRLVKSSMFKNLSPKRITKLIYHVNVILHIWISKRITKFIMVMWFFLYGRKEGQHTASKVCSCAKDDNR